MPRCGASGTAPASAAATVAKPGSMSSRSRSKWMRGASTACSGDMPKSIRLLSVCRMAVRSRLDPPEPMAIRCRMILGQGRRHHRTDPHVAWPTVEAVRVQVFLAQHVVQHDAGTGQQLTAALTVRQGHRGAVARTVDGADVGGAAVVDRMVGHRRTVGRHQFILALRVCKDAAVPGDIGVCHHLGQYPQVLRAAESG